VSASDQEFMQNLEKIWRLVKESEEISMPEDGRYYDRLHHRIMSALLKGEKAGDIERQMPRELDKKSGRRRIDVIR
jgi:hypothetical protein